MNLLEKQKGAKENLGRVCKTRDRYLILKRQLNLEINLARLKKLS